MLNSKEFVRELQLRHESAWMNPNVGSAETALAALSLTRPRLIAASSNRR